MKHGPFGPGGLVTLICYTSIKILGGPISANGLLRVAKNTVLRA